MASPSYALDTSIGRDAASQLLQPLLDLAKTSDSLIASSVGVVKNGSEEFRIPRFVFMGPKGGGNTIRVGLFSALHGDEPEGTEGLVKFIQELEKEPEVAKGFHLYAYPICNPSGFAAGTRNSTAGFDLFGEFWRDSKQPEAYYLEREIGVHSFQGVVSLHTGKSSVRFLAACGSEILDEALVQPAVRATRGLIPETVQAKEGANDTLSSGFLTTTDELHPVPFEINFSIPRLLPKSSRVQGTAAALKSILSSYRALMALGQNL